MEGMYGMNVVQLSRAETCLMPIFDQILIFILIFVFFFAGRVGLSFRKRPLLIEILIVYVREGIF